MCLRGKCTNVDDYIIQANMIGDRFVHKAYNKGFIEDKFTEVAQMDRGKLIEYKIQQVCQSDQPIILDYSIQHRKIEKIIHWHILQTDKHLQSILPNRPRYIYKRAPIIQNQVVKSVVDPPQKGFYPHKRCFACPQFKRPNKRKSTSNVTVYDIQ